MTVLFADLAGFTSRAEAMDPEDVRAFLHPWYDLLEREVAGHGGVVERHLGDGVMAVFGAPAAHEDDPERAVRAALRVLAGLPGLGLDLHARIGVNTGEVLFASASGPGREDAVTGDAVNTAARLQAAAPVDGAVVGEPTHRATARSIRYEALPPVAAKGKAEPVPAWRAVEPVARPSGELFEERTPFVGRDRELATLVRAFERSRSTPSLEAVTVVADPGLGKSRLVRELARRVDALPELVTWRVGRCLPYGEGIGFWALSEIVKAQAGILDTDGQAELAAKLEAAITEPDPSLRRWMTQRLAPLVGLETTAEPPQQEEAFTAWRRFLEGIAATGPLVLVVEDLHWADDGLVAFLRHLAANASGLPVLLVATARPEAGDRHPGWLERTTALRLSALPAAAIAALVAGSLPGASPELAATILERAAGSPLYAEQLAAMARDRPAGSPLAEGDVPATLQGLLASRIDMLPPDARAVLLDASVVGRTFWSGAAATLGHRERTAVEPILADLARRDLVRRVEPASMAGEQEFSFVHALLRDAAYGQLTRRDRLARHRAAAAWLTERASQALGEDAEIVVAHLERALELANATGATDDLPAIRDTLVEALLVAGDHAMRTEVPRAARLLDRALDLLEGGDPRRPDALARLGRARLAAWDYREAARLLEAAREGFRAAGDEVAAARLASLLHRALVNVGAADRATAILADARRVLEAHPGPELTAIIASQAQRAMIRSPDDRARSLLDEAFRVAASLGLPAPVPALAVRGSMRFATDPAGGEADLRLAAEGAVADGDLHIAVASYFWLMGCRGGALGSAAALAAGEEGIAFCQVRGIPTEAVRISRLDWLYAAGRWDDLVSEARSLHAWAVAHGDGQGVAFTKHGLALVHLSRGEPAGSLEGLAAAARDAGMVATWPAATEARAACGHGRPEQARRVLADALDTASPGAVDGILDVVGAALLAGSPELARRALEMGGEPTTVVTVETAVAKALLAEAEGALERARDGFARAADASAGLALPLDQAHALAGLGRCLLARSRTEEGVARLREAREIWMGIKATARMAEIDALLAQAGAAEPAAG